MSTATVTPNVEPAINPLNTTGGPLTENQAAESSDSEAAAFNAVAAELVNSEAAAGAGDHPVAPGEPDKFDQMCERFVGGMCSPEQVQKYLPLPFNAMAVAFKQECIRLQDWEMEMWVPAIVACGERWGPELLKNTDKPELVMLATAAIFTAGRIALQWKREPKPEVLPTVQPDSTPATTTTPAASAAGLGFSV